MRKLSTAHILPPHFSNISVYFSTWCWSIGRIQKHTCLKCQKPIIWNSKGWSLDPHGPQRGSATVAWRVFCVLKTVVFKTCFTTVSMHSIGMGHGLKAIHRMMNLIRKIYSKYKLPNDNVLQQLWIFFIYYILVIECQFQLYVCGYAWI